MPIPPYEYSMTFKLVFRNLQIAKLQYKKA